MIGTVMFLIALLLFYEYYSNTVSMDMGEVEKIRSEAQGVSNSLMSAGYPQDWNETNVEQIGIVEENFRLNETKLSQLTYINYDSTKKLLETRYDYYFYFLDKNKQEANISAYGKPGVNSTNIEEIENDKLVTLSRFVFHNKKIYRMVLYVWE